MKPDFKTELDKKIRAGAKRSNYLRRLIRNAPLVRLKQPIPHGFVRRYVLTPEAERFEDANVLRDILERIGTERYFWRRSFRRGRRAGKKQVEIQQPLTEILIDTWIQKPKKHPLSWVKYFKLEYRHWRNSLRADGKWYFVFCEPQLFRLQTRVHFLTHEKVIDPLWVEEIDEIEKWMEARNGWHVWSRLKGRKAWCSYNRYLRKRTLERLANRDLFNLNQGFEEVETRQCVKPFRFSFSFARWSNEIIVFTKLLPVGVCLPRLSP